MRKWEFIIWLCVLVPGLATGCVGNQESGLIGDGTTEQNNTPNLTDASTTQFISVGYCPAMAAELSLLKFEGAIIEGIEYLSAAHALQALQDGAVDTALIGRKPYQSELAAGFTYDQLRDGFTLVAQEKKIIPYANLVEMTIYKALIEEEIKDVFPAATHNIHFSESELLAILDNGSDVLIRWDQVEDNYNLWIPIDSQGNKIKDFRTPFFIYPEISSYLFKKNVEC
jgi:hypothetical protein